MRDKLSKLFSTKRRRLLIILVIEGIILRFLAATQGMTVDFDSYMIVAEIVRSGGALYQETTRYNYAPLWAYLISFLDLIAELLANPAVFRVLLVSVLSVADFAVSAVLYKRYSFKTSMFYWLSPLTIMGAGYFMQFDVAAIALMLIAIHKSKGTKWFGLLIGLSLVVKHVYIFFPLWLLLRKDRGKYFKDSVVAYAVLGISFLPFLSQLPYIMQRVVGYSANTAGVFPDYFVPQVLQWYMSPGMIFAITMVLAGFIFRRRPVFESAIWYLLILVVVSPSMLHTYLIIPAVVIAVFPNLIFAAYALITSYMFTLDGMGMNLDALVRTAPDLLLSYKVHDDVYILPLLLLLIGGVLHLWGNKMVQATKMLLGKSMNELQLQREQLNNYSGAR